MSPSQRSARKKIVPRKTKHVNPRKTATTPSGEPQEFPISNAMLRAMYDAMVESRLWAQSQKLVPVVSEATAVPSTVVLHRGDVLAAPADGRTLYPAREHGAEIIPLDLTRLQEVCEEHQKRRAGVTVGILREADFDSAAFQQLLGESLRRRWALVVVLLSDRFYNPDSPVPEIDVDGHDAVAMFRVVGESVRRARNRRGPAIIHAHNATDTQMPDPLGDPLMRFQRYLEAKGLSTERLHVVHTEVE